MKESDNFKLPTFTIGIGTYIEKGFVSFRVFPSITIIHDTQFIDDILDENGKEVLLDGHIENSIVIDWLFWYIEASYVFKHKKKKNESK